jgi:hypothetical protein
MKKLIILVLSLHCVACSNNPEKSAENKNNIDQAIRVPLKDLNLLREKIPEVLLEADKNPYALAKLPITCMLIDQQIDALDQVLSPDVDKVKQDELTEKNHIERGAEKVGEESINAIKRTTESLIPYRSWVRKLTGAERESKLVARAIKSGNLRRAFLKGYKASSCKPE